MNSSSIEYEYWPRIHAVLRAQVLLVTSSRRPDNWIVPGGGVEPEEEPSVTAMREVLEEAGVIGKLGRCLGVFEVKLTCLSMYTLLRSMHYNINPIYKFLPLILTLK